MLRCAIADGVFGKKNILLGGTNLARHLLQSCEYQTVGWSSSRCKLTELSYGTIIRRRETERFVLRSTSYCRGGKLTDTQIQTTRFTQTKPYDINTNLTKDVILYKYENPKYFKRLNIFGICQLLFWSYLAQFVFTELRNVPVAEMQTDDLPWWRRINLGEKTHRTVLTFITFFVGYTLFVLAWVHTLKSVRYLILRKGGNDLTIVSYTPFGENRMRTVPLNRVSSKQSRTAATVQLPIKVKGDLTHYLLDMRGEFRNPQLFDYTAGLQR